jgi:hypothetical protein
LRFWIGKERFSEEKQQSRKEELKIGAFFRENDENKRFRAWDFCILIGVTIARNVDWDCTAWC